MNFFIETIPYESAGDQLRDFYEADIKDLGVPSNTTRSFSLMPEAYGAWRELLRSIRKTIRLRDYELTTFAVARELGCTF